MEISRYLRDHSRTIMGKQQLIIGAMAKALEIIPRQICDNAGFDATDVLNKLRMRHAQGETWAGVDVEAEGVSDNLKKFVWEPVLVKTNALSSAVEAACLILSVDETVRNPQSNVSDPLFVWSGDMPFRPERPKLTRLNLATQPDAGMGGGIPGGPRGGGGRGRGRGRGR